MTTPSPPLPDPPLERLGDYEVLAPISEGGMGSVYLGRSAARPADLVALKVIRAEHGRNKEFVAMLMDEAGIASRMAHPNILAIRSLGHDGRRHFLVMELLRGRTLLEVWNAAHAQGKRLPVEIVAWIGARVADALHYAHELKDDQGQPAAVVHRDVNPANIFITKEGAPKLIDFGLAKARDRIASTAIGVVKGKLAYLAPEQANGHPADRRSDVFALGVTLWEISLDRRLFLDDSDVQTVRRVREAEVPDPTTLVNGYPRAMADALIRALARDPKDRWQTAAELRNALDAFVRSAAHPVDTASVRALMTDLFASDPPAAWERIADEATADQAKTRVWDERKAVSGWEPEPPTEPAARPAQAPAPMPLAVEAPPTDHRPARFPLNLMAIAAVCALLGAILVGLAARGCRGGGKDLDRRVTRIEDLLGIADAGAPAPGAALAPDAGAAVSADEHAAPCALAKVASYQAWQDAWMKAKVNAHPAEAACAALWGDKKRQSCYHVAMAEIHATQAARDAVITGGAMARDAVKSVSDDPKNEAIARARSASDAAFAACDDDGGT